MYIVSPKKIIFKYSKIIKGIKCYTGKYSLHVKESSKGRIEEQTRDTYKVEGQT